MEYKRLTKKDKRGFYHYNCTEKDQEDCEVMENCGECYGTRVLYRLAELEDKIEQGTLIELPCKVGDTCYLVYERAENRFRDLYEIKKVKINNIHYIGHNEFLAEIGMVFHYTVKFGEEIFTTREEAEKRLKELQE